MARLFVALWLPPTIRQQLDTLPRPEIPGVRWVPPEQWHVTLRFLGEADPSEARAALDGVPLPSARAVLGPTTRRLGNVALVIPADGLDDLAAAVTTATARVGAPPGRRGFSGHVTLARIPRGVRTSIEPSAVDGSFDVEEVALVRSDLSPAGATYHPIGRWPTTRYPPQ